jgi:hypothetical protein
MQGSGKLQSMMNQQVKELAKEKLVVVYWELIDNYKLIKGYVPPTPGSQPRLPKLM